jgi:hypothetical protein
MIIRTTPATTRNTPRSNTTGVPMATGPAAHTAAKKRLTPKDRRQAADQCEEQSAAE